MHRIVRLAGLAAVVVAAVAGAAGATVVQIGFEQYAFESLLTLESTPPSGIGGCVVEFVAEPDAGYLNVAAVVPGLSPAPQWVVHNLRLHTLEEGVPVETITSTFPLAPLGLEPGVPAGALLYAYEVRATPLLDADAPVWLQSVVFNNNAVFQLKSVQVGKGSLAVPPSQPAPGSSTWFPPATTSGADTVKSAIGCRMPNLDLNGATNPNDVNACAPTSAANSLKWLDAEHDEILIPEDGRSAMEQIGRLAGRVGPVGIWPQDLARAKLDFCEARNLPIHVKIQDRSSQGDITSTSGRTTAADKDAGAASWPTRDFIFNEAAKGEDVEVIVTWYYVDDDGQLKPSNYAHAVVLAGAGTKAGADYLQVKDDKEQGRAGGLRQVDTGVTSLGWGIELPGLNIEIPDGPGKGKEGRAIVSSVVSESLDTKITPPPPTERFSGYCQLVKRTVPANGTITFGFPAGSASRSFSASLIVREAGPQGHSITYGPWNLNGGQTRAWTNNRTYPVVVMLHNDDKAGNATPYPAWDVGVTITSPPVAKRLDDPFNPADYGGFSLGGRDSSSAEFSPVELGAAVVVGPVDLGFDLNTVPSHLAGSGGTGDLSLQAVVHAWNRYWERLGLVVDVLSVVSPGDLIVTCPASGCVDTLAITAPGRYETTLGTLAPVGMCEVRLVASPGLDVTLDAIGVPTLVTVPVSGAPVPASPARLRAVPNPFNPSTQLTFALAHAGPARLAVYDVAGRLVRTLLDGQLPAGPGAREWDGRDDRGRAVASGGYFARFESREGAQTIKVSLAR